MRDILADGFVDTAYNGVLRTKQDLLSQRAAQGISRETLSDLRVRFFNSVAIVTGRNTVVGALSDGRHYTVALRFTDVFEKRSGRWRAIAAQESMSVRR